jgi:chemotaxis regulatin CheY-phosphate phosphatase CheZ
MAAPRKIFRIEETAAARLKGDGAQPPAYIGDMPAHHGEIMQALGALQAMMNRTARPPIAATAPSAAAELRAALLTRIAHELEAVTAGTAQATQRILTAAEEIDQLADNLSAALRGKIEQDLAHDISDQVIRIFEACNFQDLIGQRIGKVMATLKLVEDNIASVLNGTKTTPAPRRDGAPLLHGPRLESDHGHVTQSDIDAMFGG